MGYQSSINYLYGLQKYGIKFGLTSISKLLAELGNPHRHIRCVHIAGSNGKGSTAAFIASMLSEAGYKTGLYTSPHLLSFTERIRINNREISRRSVDRLTGLIREAAARLDSITFFEFVTAMAFSFFAEKKVDCAVIETGMGGRLDATNVITPLLSVITTISMEHESFLGNTIQSIAKEKAGIIKCNGVLLTAVRQASVRRLFREKCRKLNASMFVMGRHFSLRRSQSLTYRGMWRDIDNLRLGLRGDHQIDNAALALAAVEVLCRNGFTINDAAVRRGLKYVVWPGRLETQKCRTLVAFDGAHNPDAMRCLKQAILSGFEYERLLLVLGIMNDKDVQAMLKEIVPIASMVYLCRPRMDRAASTASLAGLVQRCGVPYAEMHSVRDALFHAVAESRRRDLVCVTGSLFTVGEAKEALTQFSGTAACAVGSFR